MKYRIFYDFDPNRLHISIFTQKFCKSMIFYCGSTKAHILESFDFVFDFPQKLYMKINKIPYIL